MIKRVKLARSAWLLGMATAIGAAPLAPASAQVRTVKEAAAEYEKGVKSGVTPVTRGEMTMCLGYWLALKTAHEDWPKDPFWSKLPNELSLKAATLYVQGWAGLLVKEIGDDARAQQQLNRDTEQAANRAYDKISAAAENGGIAGYFETLGTCRFSAK
jgi:hypothetical protein